LRHKTGSFDQVTRGRDAFLGRLYKEGARRWFLLLAAAAFLVWLSVFAGHVRRPGGVKRSWAVVTSRLLAVAGGVIALRLLMLPYEERVPVLLLSLPRLKGDFESNRRRLLGLYRRGYQPVPLFDVVMLIRERRYVPKKCLGLVLEVSSVQELADTLNLVRDLKPTFLLPWTAFDACDVKSPLMVLPEDVGLGIVIGGRTGTGPTDSTHLKQCLVSVAERSLEVVGRKVEYLLIETPLPSDSRGVLKASGYTSVLDGKGYNRYGDEGHLIRVIDVTDLMAAGMRVHPVLSAYLSLYKGAYLAWPVVAVDRMIRHG
jgi:hypothetical protein